MTGLFPEQRWDVGSELSPGAYSTDQGMCGSQRCEFHSG